MKLIIVESPNKATTIERWLGKEYKVLASGGHVRDLPESAFGIDIKNNYEPKYVISASKRTTIAKLKEAKAKADYVYLATDPDREGEAISWHLANILGIKTDEPNRIEFNEITESAVKKAINNPRTINLNLVDAQQARRVLDRIVGYTLSPIICKRIQPQLSAGRVQSVALKLIVDKEKEIISFNPKEYWTITGKFSAVNDSKKTFTAKLHSKNGKKYVPDSEESANAVVNAVKNSNIEVSALKKSTTKTHAPAPYTTSTLQQDGANKLSFSSSQTMKLAQSLYEGINIPGEGHVALITYIRTDSVRISKEAAEQAKKLIVELFGSEYYPDKPNFYKNKNSSQDAHEAIRPISLERTPKSLEGKLEKNQLKLYRMIYERFVSSQMAEAKYNSIACEVKASEYMFKANGSTLLFKGYLAAFSKYKDDEQEEDNVNIPNIAVGDKLNLNDIKNEKKFTKPPARYTDASLIKELEENGIGRPSTYATILTVLQKRQYTNKEGKFIHPTEIAFGVTDFLSENFKTIMKTDFTANVEKQLDDIEFGDTDWRKIVDEFYIPFNQMVENSKKSSVELTEEKCPQCGASMYKKAGRYGPYFECSNETCSFRKNANDVITDIVCEKCGSKMIKKKGKYGEYLSCSNYPSCSNIVNLNQEESDEICDKCGSKMLIKMGKYGKFLACSNYPACKNIKSFDKPVAKCPKCGKDVFLRKSKKGNAFYSCSGYPNCDFISWDLPLSKSCPKCGNYLVSKDTKNGTIIKCSNKECDYIE